MVGSKNIFSECLKTAAAMFVFTTVSLWGLTTGMALEGDPSSEHGRLRGLDPASIVVEVDKKVRPADYPLLRKVEAPGGFPFETASPESAKLELAEAAPRPEATPSQSATPKPEPPESVASDSGPQAANEAKQASPVPEPAAAGEPEAVRRAAGISAELGRDAVVVRIVTQGVQQGSLDYRSYTLPDPNRLVVDLPGHYAHKGEPLLRVARAGVRKVRAGRHPERFRVVFDLEEGVAADRIEPALHGLSVIFSKSSD